MIPGGRSKWPDLEQEIYDQFIHKRAAGDMVRRGWFRNASKDYFKKIYSESSTENEQFCFSRGWFAGFLTRYQISIQFTTNKAQKIPLDYLTPILEFFRFNQRVSQPVPGEALNTVGRYSLARIANMDQTPAPFEYLSSRTYAEKGSHTIWARAQKSGWDK